MINASKTLTLILMLCACSVFGQQKVQKATDLPGMIKLIQSSKQKILFLQEFLASVKTKPLTYGKSTSSVRDSVNHNLQLQYNALLLTIFDGALDSPAKKIQKSTGNAYEIAMQTINGQYLTKRRELLLNQYVAESHQLISKYSFLKNWLIQVLTIDHPSKGLR